MSSFRFSSGYTAACLAISLGVAAELPTVLPESVIAKYGKPDKVDSTEYDNPRPPLVTKFVIYKKENVRFVFLADAPIGSPPPYKSWKLLGAQDPRDDSVLRAEEVERRMASRKRK
jgi:hypothetical protein